MKLQDKVALITGGAQGLGKSIALAMAREGANIVICDINPDTIPAATAEIEALGRQCLGVRCDVSSSDSVRQLVPLGRLRKPEEYASLAVYLASDEHYLVGQTISPNGGMLL